MVEQEGDCLGKATSRQCESRVSTQCLRSRGWFSAESGDVITRIERRDPDHRDPSRVFHPPIPAPTVSPLSLRLVFIARRDSS